VKRPRIAVLGSVHMDLIARTQTLPALGQSVVGHGFTMAPGGKGGNQACQCALMGAETFMLTSLGDDLFGRELMQALKTKGVNTDFVAIDKTHATGASTVLSAEDGYSSVIYPGAAAHMTPAQIDVALSLLGELDALILQLELPLPLVTHAAKQAKAKGVNVILNYSPKPMAKPDDLLNHISILVMNEHEALDFSGPESLNSTVIITSGRKGAKAWHQGKSYAQAAIPATVVDTVGAGDAFLGAAISLLSEGRSMDEALRHGAAAGALAVGRSGAFTALPTRSEIEVLLKSRVEL
jgi:ribokinase